MTTKNTDTMLAYFRRNLKNNPGFDSHIWYNIDKVLDDKDMAKIKRFFIKYNANLVIIIKGIKYLRPQRTWGGLPEWFRSADALREVHPENSSFVFISWDEIPDHDETDEEYAARRKEFDKAKVGFAVGGKYTDRSDYFKSRGLLIRDAMNISEEANCVSEPVIFVKEI